MLPKVEFKMKIKKEDLKWDYTKASTKGGQHANKTHTGVRLTHIPTGIVVRITGRSQDSNKIKALSEMEKRLDNLAAEKRAAQKKANRDHRIKNTKTVRTYDWKKGLVIDHRSGKKVSLKKMLKGKVDLEDLSTDDRGNC